MWRIIKSFGFALKGFKYAFKTQVNFKVHVLATLVVLALGVYVNLSINEWLWTALSIALVLILELVNTAIELLVDLVSPSLNPKAGAIKDMAAGAVLLATLFAIVVGLLIFVPKLLA
jgi:diacylglycerol kinase